MGSIHIDKGGTFEGIAYASYDNAYTAGFLDLRTYYDASGNVVASEAFQTNGGYSITLNGALFQQKTVNADGSSDIRTYKAGTFQGVSYASFDNSYTSTGFRDLETFYDASGNVLAKEAFQTNGGYSITVGGALYQQKTVNADGSSDIHTYKAGTFEGISYASFDNSYTSAGFRDLETFYDASGDTLVSEAFQANGSHDVHTYKAGTFQGVSYASFDNAYTSTGFRDLETFYAASGNVLATEAFQTNGGYSITVGGALYQQKTVNADGSSDIHTYKAGTFEGISYASFDNAYTSTGFRDLETFDDASGNTLVSEAFQANGSHDVHTYKAGTFEGVSYASFDNAYTSTGFRDLETFYAASGNVVAAETFQTNGGADIHIYKAGTFQGVSYASFDNSYTSTGFRDLETFYDASGNVLATEAFQTNGGYSITVGGALYQQKTVNADGSSDIRTYMDGMFAGVSYASFDNSYTSKGFRDLETYYDASGNALATETFQANGDDSITVGGALYQQKTVNANGSSDVRTYMGGTFLGGAYASFDNAYTPSGILYLRTYYNGVGATVAQESFGTSGAYSVTLNSALYQQSGLNVAIAGTKTYTITYTQGSATLASLSIADHGVTLAIAGGGIQLDNGTGAGANAGTIAIDGDTTLEISGAFLNRGSVVLTSSGGYPSLMIDNAASLTGAGRVDLDSAGGGLSQILGDATNDGALTNLGNTIDGFGRIGGGDGRLTFTNSAGTVDADSAAGGLGVVTGNLVTNTAKLEATAGGTLTLYDLVANAGGTIEALGAGAPTSTVDVNGAVTGGVVEAIGAGGLVNIEANVASAAIEATGGGSIDVTQATLTDDTISVSGAGSSLSLNYLSFVSGGALTTKSGGVIESDSGVIDGSSGPVTLSAGSRLLVVDSGSLVLKGAIDDAGEIDIGDSANTSWTTLSVDGAVSLTGGGKVSLVSANGFSGIFADGAGTLVNDGDAIDGAGGIGGDDGRLTIDNTKGVIEADVAAKTLGISTGATVTNSATLEARAGGQLSISDSVTNTGGAIEALAGSAVTIGASVTGGVVEASGAGSVVNIRSGVTGATVEAAGGGAIAVQQATLTDDTISVTGAGSSLSLDYMAGVSGGTLTAKSGGAILSYGGALDGSTASVGLSAGSKLQIVDSNSLDVKGTLVDAGEIDIGDAASAFWTEFYVDGAVSLTGGGRIDLIAAAKGASWIFGNGSDFGTLTDNGDTIQGAGGVGGGDGHLTLDNASGVIDANVAGENLGISTGNAVTNGAKLEATAGGLLSINDSVTNAGGVIEALAASTVDLYAPVTGGVVEASGAGSLVNVRSGVTGAKVVAIAGGAIAVQQVTLTDDTISVAGAGSSLALNYMAVVSGGTLTAAAADVIEASDATFDGSSSQLTLGGGSKVQIVDSISSDVKGTIDNAGAIDIGDAASASWTELVVSGAATLTGGGEIAMTAAASGTSWIWGDGSDPGVLTNKGNQIVGAGGIGAGGNGDLTFDNVSGTVEASGGTISIDTGNVVGDSGVLEAADGAQLKIDDNVKNAGGVIEALGGLDPVAGLVDLSGATITGGKVNAVGGEVEAESATFSGVTLDASQSGYFEFDGAVIAGGSLSSSGSGLYQVNSATTLDGAPAAVTVDTTLGVATTTLKLQGRIVDDQAIAAMSGASPTFDIDGAVSLSGGGDLFLSSALDLGVGSGKGFVYGDASDGGVLTNVDDVISGDGQIGGNGAALQLLNRAPGVIDATGRQGIVIETGATVANAGILEASNPFGLAATGGLTIDDAVANSGTIFANGGNVTAVGALTGAGTVRIASGATATLDGASTNGALFGGAGELTLADAPGMSGNIAGLTSADSIDLADLAFAYTSVSQILGSGAAGTVTSVTFTDNDPSLAAPLSATLHLLNGVAGEYGTAASDYTLSADSQGKPGTVFQLAAPHV